MHAKIELKKINQVYKVQDLRKYRENGDLWFFVVVGLEDRPTSRIIM